MSAFTKAFDRPTKKPCPGASSTYSVAFIPIDNNLRSGITCARVHSRATRAGDSITSSRRGRLRKNVAKWQSTSSRDGRPAHRTTHSSGLSSNDLWSQRLRAAVRACLDNAVREAALRPSRFSARKLDFERLGDAFCPARSRSRLACVRVRADVVPLLGVLNLTPARRALDKPIAIACFVDRAPCFPSRTCSISSRTNSPACVDGALPSRFALRARSRVFFSGIQLLQIHD